MKRFYPQICTVLLFTVALLGCDSSMMVAVPYKCAATAAMVIPHEHDLMWDKLATSFHFKTYEKNPRVQRFIKQYEKENFEYLIHLSKQAHPYLYHVVQMLEENGMPAELALLPIIESEYKPTAASNMGAVGLWQLVYMTGRLYGLKQDQWYDGRKDIEAATKAALGHIQYLQTKYNGDWLLTLAAYNCGDARVSRAINANKRLGKKCDYWSLNLPQQTQHYVPKFLALVHLIQNYRKLQINLDPIPNRPYFDKVKIEKQIHFEHVAKLAEIDIKEVKKLNPAFRAQTTHPNGPHEIALPVQHIATFKTNLKAANRSTILNKPTVKQPLKTMSAPNKIAPKAHKVITNKNIHIVSQGDTLAYLATKYHTTVDVIKYKNKLTSDTIHIGQKLLVL